MVSFHRKWGRSCTNPKVKELLKLVHSCQSYRKNKSGTFFMAHGVQSTLNRVYHANYLNIVHLIFFTDAPRNMQISPRNGTYSPGDRIQCSAEGIPAPSYQWTDLISGTVIQRDVLVISEDMVNKSYSFQCTARNQYGSNSSTLNFTVTGIKTTNFINI